MDKELEQRIRERAYELWIRHGSLPGLADEYWFQAEREILGEENGRPQTLSQDEERVSMDTSPAPLGMVSETLDELPPSPAPKTRRRRSGAAEPPVEEGGTPTPRRRGRKPAS